MARDFPGTSGNYLVISNPSGPLDVTGTVLSISAWIKLDGTGADQDIITKAGTGATTFQYVLGVTSTARLRVAIGNSAGIDLADGSTPLSTGVWYHVYLYKNGTGASALGSFLNGSLEAAVTSNRAIQDTANDVLIGARDPTVNNFNGRIAEVAVWNIALGSTRIAALAKGASPLRVAPYNLAAYYPLWTSDAARDMSGNGQHMSTAGSSPTANHPPVEPYVLL